MSKKRKQTIILDALRLGAPVKTACDLAKVPTGTVHGWRRREHFFSARVRRAKDAGERHLREIDKLIVRAGARAGWGEALVEAVRCAVRAAKADPGPGAGFVAHALVSLSEALDKGRAGALLAATAAVLSAPDARAALEVLGPRAEVKSKIVNINEFRRRA